MRTDRTRQKKIARRMTRYIRFIERTHAMWVEIVRDPAMSMLQPPESYDGIFKIPPSQRLGRSSRKKITIDIKEYPTNGIVQREAERILEKYSNLGASGPSIREVHEEHIRGLSEGKIQVFQSIKGPIHGIAK